MKPSCFEAAPGEGGGDRQCAAVILAAGKGTRMMSDLPKVLHELSGKPLIEWVVDSARASGLGPLILVVGHEAELVERRMEPLNDGNLRFVLQAEQNGTGHALQVCEPELRELEGDVLVLAGDVPLIRQETLQELLEKHRDRQAAVTMLTAVLDDPAGYGRVLRDEAGEVLAVREHRDCNEAELAVAEINSGIYVFRLPDLLTALSELRPENDQAEYYLTDTLEILKGRGERVAAVICGDESEIAGINNREQLAAMEALVELRKA